jgi:flagellar biosynthesis chaperone FliJ
MIKADRLRKIIAAAEEDRKDLAERIALKAESLEAAHRELSDMDDGIAEAKRQLKQLEGER